MARAMWAVEQALDGLGRGDHACCTLAAGQTGRPGLVAAFARDAFAYGHRMVYVADEASPDEVRGWLAGGGVDVGAREASGWLDVRSSGELYADDGFDPEATVAGFAAERDRALGEGFSGLSVMADMSWAPRMLDDLGPLAEYERRVRANFAEGNLRGLCAYDPVSFEPDALAELTGLHETRFAVGEGWSTATRAALTVAGGADRGTTLEGELDLASAPFARARFEPLLHHDADAVVDLSALEYLDISGGRELLRLAGQLGDRGRTLRLRGARPLVAQVLRLCGADRHPCLDLA